MVAPARLLTVLYVFAFLTGGLVKAEVDEVRAKAIAAEHVRTKMAFEPSHPLRATRREDWEDSLFRLQVKIKGQIAKAAYFFEVTESGYFVLSPEEAIFVSTTDGERMWTVAVLLRDGSAYGLYGFVEADAEFNRLVGAARLDVRSEADAEAAALMFFATTRDPRERTVVFRSRQLKHMVEDYFLSKLPEPRADSRSRSWWRGFAEAKLSDDLGVRSVPNSGGYSLSVTHIRSEDGTRLQLAALGLKVCRAGTCETTGTTVVYRPPG